MKTKTKFDSTSDARNLINSVVEKFPKGPERDGLQTKLREFYNCFVGAMRLPQGYDRLKVIEEGTQNLHAAQRIADRVDKQNGNAKFSTMISILASNLTDLKRDHSKTGKVEDNFYGKRVVKGIFAKAKFASHPSWSEGILGKETDPKLAAYSWISKNNIESGRRQMLLADLAAGMYENNKSLSIAQAVLAAAKDMVRKGVATTEIQQWAGNGGKFARTGAKAKFSMSVSYDPATELLTVGNKHYKCSRSQSGYVLNVLRNVRNAKNPSNEQARAIDEFQREGIISITDKTFNSKAKFANEEIAKGLSKVLKANGFNAMASEVLSGSTDSETLRKYIRALKSKMSPMSGNDRGMVLLQTLEKQLASRTGAKVFK